MTTIEFLNAVINETTNTEIAEKAQALIAAHAKQGSARKVKDAEKRAEANAPLFAQILAEVEVGTTVTASEVAEAIEVSPQKASALMKALVAQGEFIVGEAKAKGRTIKAYTRVG